MLRSILLAIRFYLEFKNRPPVKRLLRGVEGGSKGEKPPFFPGALKNRFRAGPSRTLP
ncbi:hypothetical protein TthHB5008_17610 [Thermus thermophilus]|nr:hypothetical protein TthHB5008_17610 [Thermus thermophilus]